MRRSNEKRARLACPLFLSPLSSGPFGERAGEPFLSTSRPDWSAESEAAVVAAAALPASGQSSAVGTWEPSARAALRAGAAGPDRDTSAAADPGPYIERLNSSSIPLMPFLNSVTPLPRLRMTSGNRLPKSSSAIKATTMSSVGEKVKNAKVGDITGPLLPDVSVVLVAIPVPTATADPTRVTERNQSKTGSRNPRGNFAGGAGKRRPEHPLSRSPRLIIPARTSQLGFGCPPGLPAVVSRIGERNSSRL